MRGPAAKREISKYWIFFAWYHKCQELKFSWSNFQTKEKMFFRNVFGNGTGYSAIK